MKKVLVVYNVNAGRKKSIKYKKKLQKVLLKNAESFKFITIDEFDYIDIANFDTIIAMGGDGTVNKVLPHLINTDKTLGVIPCGTANLLAAKLGINSVSKAVKAIYKNKTSKIDLMTINNRLSILRCGIGYDSNIICHTPQSLKNRFGYFAYFVAGMLFALRLKKKEYCIKTDNHESNIKASCIIVANAPNMFRNLISVGNNSKLNDGLFDVFVLKTQNPVLFFVEFLKILLGYKASNSAADYFQTNNLNLKAKYFDCHIDGEKSNFTKEIECKMIKDAINVYTLDK